eukprot:PhF_6_TR44522/c0_g1_i1/m.68579/K14662/NTAN1; protein N-terminal asparagine amidohydrolase
MTILNLEIPSTPKAKQLLEESVKATSEGAVYLKTTSSTPTPTDTLDLLHDPKVLYIAQREYATVKPGCIIDILTVSDATSCVIVCIRNPTTGVTSMTHLDGSPGQVSNGILRMVQEVRATGSTSMDDVLDVYIVGGFEEVEHTLPIMTELLSTLHHTRCGNVQLRVSDGCCFWTNNTSGTGKQRACILTCLAVEVTTGRCWIPKYTSHVYPLAALRTLRFMGESHLTCVWDNTQQCVTIEPYDFGRAKPYHNYSRNMDDAEFLRHFSTTPSLEAPYYVSSLRECFLFAHQNDVRNVFGQRPQPKLVKFAAGI